MIETHDDMKWTVLQREYLFNRPWLTVRRDKVQLPNGKINPEYYVLEYPIWVNVIAITENGDFVMVRQYRHGIGDTRYELVAGVAEEGETPEQAARRELREETGYGEGEWKLLVKSSANPGTHNNMSYSFLAEGVKKIDTQHLDETEDVDVYLLKPEEVFSLIESGEMIQALMAVPLWKYFYSKK